MIKKLVLGLLLMRVGIVVAGAYVTAPNLKMKGQFYSTRLFHQYHHNFNLMAEHIHIDTDIRQRQVTTTLGGKYRLGRNLKMGAYYQRASGQWHEEDWLAVGGGEWAWANTAPRGENLAILEASPRAQLTWLPGRTWVFEQRFRYFYNFFNDQQHLRTRSQLTYFWLGATKPLVNLTLSYEWYLPFNYGRRVIYETWFYLGALYHVNEVVKVGITYALRKQYWQAIDRFRARTGLDFRSVDTATLWGLNLTLIM